MTRRQLLLGSASIAAISPRCVGAPPELRIGDWQVDGDGLPSYAFTGALPANARDRSGADAQEVPDPAFLIGNDRITVFAHVSGILQILTGERAWARVNAADVIDYGDNRAQLAIGGSTYELVGLGSMAADPARTRRRFGCGFARHDYRLDPALSARRVVSVAPSPTVGTGNAGLVVSITLSNAGPAPQRFDYEETLRNHYVPVGQQKHPPAARPGTYVAEVIHDAPHRLALARNRFVPHAFLAARTPEEASLTDTRPADVFLHVRSSAPLDVSTGRSDSRALHAHVHGMIPAGGSVTFDLVIGLTYGDVAAAQRQAADLLAASDPQDRGEGRFHDAWRRHLPAYDREPSPVLRTELVWNAHALAAMATWSDYFGETFVPQGTVYAYEDGENISNRDNLQALLPLCYIDPPRARSALRHVFRQTTPIGEIRRGTGGYGYVSPGVYKESDEHLYLFMALGEYLRITGDAAILDDRISFYPKGSAPDVTVLAMLERHFEYLRDEIGVGPHGLIRMLNSDWSDSFFHAYSPNVTLGAAESHLNSAMALAVMPALIAALGTAGPRAAALGAAMADYRARLAAAFLADLGTRDFSARAYLNEGRPSDGLDTVCLEPQGFLLQLPDLPTARKRAIYARIRVATIDPEKVGARIRERPIFGGTGEGEDGGIWFALEHQLVAGVATFDRAEARRLLHLMSFHNFAARYPDYWLGRWTHSDSMQSSLSPREGLMNYWYPTLRQSGFGYCSHPHSWPLYNYHRLMD